MTWGGWIRCCASLIAIRRISGSTSRSGATPFLRTWQCFFERHGIGVMTDGGHHGKGEDDQRDMSMPAVSRRPKRDQIPSTHTQKAPQKCGSGPNAQKCRFAVDCVVGAGRTRTCNHAVMSDTPSSEKVTRPLQNWVKHTMG